MKCAKPGKFVVLIIKGGCDEAFCYVCEQAWEPDHTDHYKCHKFDK